MDQQFHAEKIKEFFDQFETVLHRSMCRAVLGLQQAYNYLNQSDNAEFVKNALQPFVDKINDKAIHSNEIYSEPMVFSEVLFCIPVFSLVPNALPFCMDEQLKYTLSTFLSVEPVTDKRVIQLNAILEKIDVNYLTLLVMSDENIMCKFKPRCDFLVDYLDNVDFSVRAVFFDYLSIVLGERLKCSKNSQQLLVDIENVLKDEKHFLKLANDPLLIDLLLKNQSSLENDLVNKLKLMNKLNKAKSSEDAIQVLQSHFLAHICECRNLAFMRLLNSIGTFERFLISQKQRFKFTQNDIIGATKDLIEQANIFILQNFKQELGYKQVPLRHALFDLSSLLTDLKSYLNDEKIEGVYKNLIEENIKSMLNLFCDEIKPHLSNVNETNKQNVIEWIIIQQFDVISVINYFKRESNNALFNNSLFCLVAEMINLYLSSGVKLIKDNTELVEFVREYLNTQQKQHNQSTTSDKETQLLSDLGLTM